MDGGRTAGQKGRAALRAGHEIGLEGRAESSGSAVTTVGTIRTWTLSLALPLLVTHCRHRV